jgi:hypothetical protein
MPIVEPAVWRHQYFDHVACPADVWIPADDPEAWLWYPRHRWVFDKLAVALSQGFIAGPHGLMPPSFPVFSKPIMNFRGMGIGSRVITDAAAYAAGYAAGHMWMPLLDGSHVSTDLALVDGEACWIRHATGRPTTGGMFDYWTIHAEPMPELSQTLLAWCRAHMAGYTGILNVETIGSGIIEAHLRLTDQWPDLYGRGWVQALVQLHAETRWSYADDDRRTGYSIALFAPHGRRFRHPPKGLVSALVGRPGVSSLQITFHEDKPPEAHGNPPGGFRLALVNAWDLEAGLEARRELAMWFGVEVA